MRIFLFFMTLLSISSIAHASKQIRVVGSSTVYPFVTVAAEEFGANGTFKTPVVEATGTGGGIKLFCSGTGAGTPDMVNASRAMKATEIDNCKKNGIDQVAEIKLGFDGIVMANTKSAKPYSLTREQIFNALAAQVAIDGKLVDNPHTHWNQIDDSLPNKKIEVYGPPPTSGTRDAFVELVFEPSCVNNAAFKAAYPDKKLRKKACHVMRHDGHYIESGENDNLIIQKLVNNPTSLGIFGYSFLEQNSGVVQGVLVENTEPTYDNIANGSYPVSRPLYVYVKHAHFSITSGLKEFVEEIISERAIGQEGYLTFRGLVPMDDEERNKVKEQFSAVL